MDNNSNNTNQVSIPSGVWMRLEQLEDDRNTKKPDVSIPSGVWMRLELAVKAE